MGAFAAPALSIGQAAVGYAGAAARNDGLQGGINSARRGAVVQTRQLSAAAGLEQQKAINEARAVMGRIRVLTGGGSQLLLNQAAYDSAANQAIINANYANAAANVRSGYQAQAAQLSSQYVSPIIAGFQGALGGLSQGLVIGDALAPSPGSTTATYGAGGNSAGPPSDNLTPPFFPY